MREQIFVVTQSVQLVNQIQVLAGGQYNVRQVKTRRETIEAAVRNKPVVCIVDTNAPNVDGYEICGTLKGEYDQDHLCFILLLGPDATVDLNRADLVSVDCTLTQPLEKKIFMEKLAHYSRKGSELLKRKSGIGNGIQHQIDNAIEPDFDMSDSLFQSTAEQYTEMKSDELPSSKAIHSNLDQNKSESVFYHGVDEWEDDMKSSSGDDGPLIVSQGFQESNLNEPSKDSLPLQNPDYLESKMLAQTDEGKTVDDINSEIKDSVISKNLSDARIDRIIHEAIEEKLTDLTQERIDRIVVEAVEEKLTKALSAMSQKIHKAIRQAVEKELENRLQAEVDSVLAKKS